MKSWIVNLMKVAAVGTAFLLASATGAGAQVLYSTAGNTYTQNFDSVLNGVGANNSLTNTILVLPTGWTNEEFGANRDLNIRVDNGSSGTGDSYLHGATASGERALGGYSSGSLDLRFGVRIKNTTGGTLNNFTITFDVEQWKDGGSATAVTNVDAFAYAVNATSLGTGSYTNDTALDLVAVTNNLTSDRTMDGNLAINRRSGVTKTFTTLNLANNDVLWLRWTDANETGNDDGISIDNFTFSTPAPVPSITVQAGTLAFGSVVAGATSAEQSYTVSGASLTGNITNVAPAGFEISVTSGSGFGNSLVLTQSAGTVASTPIYVRFVPALVQSYSASITHDSPGASQQTNALTGTGTLAAEPTTDASAITFSSVQISQMGVSWTSGNGASRIVLAKAGSAPTGTPVDGTGYSANSAYGSGAALGDGFVVYSGSGSSFTMSGLTTSNAYHLKVFEFNGSGVAVNYRTGGTPASGNRTTLSAEPTTQSSGIGFSNVSATNMDVSWSSGNGGLRVVVVKQGSAVNSSPVDAASYTANAIFGSGSQIGTGNYVAYIGNGATFNLQGVSPSTAYHLAIYEFNGAGGNENYLTTAPAIASQSSGAGSTAPSVNSPTAAAFTNNGATLGATISSDGGSAIISRGTVWGTSASPTGNSLNEGGTSVAAFTHARSGMTAGTLIYYRGFASNSVNIAYSADGTFWTTPNAPVASAASSIAGTSFSANWSTATGATNYLLDVATDSGFSAFVSGYDSVSVGNVSTYGVSGLAQGTVHYYRLRAQNSGGVSSNSATINLTTLAPPTLTTPISSAITNNGATLGATITSDGGSAITERGTFWETSASLTGNKLPEGGTSVAAFSSARNGMPAGTLIYFRGYASNGVNIAYSADGTFYTSPDAPVAVAATLVSYTSFSANWTAPTGATNHLLDVATDGGFGSLVGGYNNLAVGTVTTYAVSGLASGSNYFYRVRAQNAGGVSSNSAAVGTNTIFTRTLSEGVFPVYMQGGLASNTKRAPYAFSATLGNLAPNASYNYTIGCVTNGDLATANGAGNAIYVTNSGSFVRSSGQSLASAGNYGSFTTDGSGTFTGWFIVEPTGNGRFATAGNQVFVRLAFNDGAGGTVATSFATSTNSITILAFNTSGANAGTGIRGSSLATDKNFAILYDNTAGTGRPLAGTVVEDDGVAETTANSYVAFYNSPVNGTSGAWGTIIPNSNASGVRRIEQRSKSDLSVVGFNTSANGTWPSSAATVNPAGGDATPIVITSADAPLVLVRPSVAFSAASVSDQSESAGAVNISIQLTSADTGTVQLTSIGGATLGSDFTLSATDFTFTVANSTQTLTVTIADDAAIESAELVSLRLTNAVGITLGSVSNFSFNILDNDAKYFRFDATNFAATLESAGPATVNVQLSATADATVQVASAGSATLGADFTLSSTQFVFTAGGATSQVLTVMLLDDTLAETSETVSLNLAGASGGAAQGFTNFAFTILDNEPSVQWTTSTATGSEGGATVQVTVYKSSALNNVSGQFSAGGSATLASDYTVSATNFTLNGATTSVTFTVTITDDAAIEGDESAIFTLVNLVGAATGIPATLTLTIQDNDALTPLTPGDIAIIGRINNGAPDTFAIVTLTNIQAGQVVYFTDNGWQTAGGYRGASATDGDGNENLIKLAFTNAVAAGTIIVSTNVNAAYAWTRGGSIPGTSAGSFADLTMGAVAEQIYAFTGPTTNPLFTVTTNLFVLDDTLGFEDATSSSSGAIPPGLSSNGNTALSFNFGAFNFIGLDLQKAGSNTQTTKAGWLAFIANASNWTTGASGNLPAGTLNFGTYTCDGGLAPVIVLPASTTIAGGNTANFIFAANDPTCVAPALSVTGLPSGATFTTTITTTNRVGTFSWVTTTNNYGVHPIRLTATDGTLTSSTVVRIYVSQPAEGSSGSGVPLSLTNWVVPVSNVFKGSSGNATLVWSAATGIGYDIYSSTNEYGRETITWQKIASATAGAAQASVVVGDGLPRKFFSVALAGEQPATIGIWAVIQPTIPPGFSSFSAPVSGSDLKLNGAFGTNLASALSGDNGGVGDNTGDEVFILNPNGSYSNLYLDASGVWRTSGGAVATHQLNAGQGILVLRNSISSAQPRFAGPVGNTSTKTNTITVGTSIIGFSEGKALTPAQAFASPVSGAPVSSYDEEAADEIIFMDSDGSYIPVMRLPDGTWLDLTTFSTAGYLFTPGTAAFYVRRTAGGTMKVRF